MFDNRVVFDAHFAETVSAVLTHSDAVTPAAAGDHEDRLARLRPHGRGPRLARDGSRRRDPGDKDAADDACCQGECTRHGVGDPGSAEPL